MSSYEHTDWDRDAYDPDNPKHPDWENLAADRADMERKRLKEEGPMELEVLEPQDEIVLFTGDPAARMQQMAETAAIIAEPVRARHTVKISGREHVRVEGWTMLGALLGVHPYLVWSRPIENEDGLRRGWEARVEARTRAGDVVGSAEAMCTQGEKTWAGRDEYALRSMAQTRATSKAMRQPLGFIITLAGFDATPAEEMPSTETFKAPAAAGGLPITEPQTKKIFLLRDKLVKAGVFTIQAYDESMQKLYGTQRVNELNREQARELIDRLEAVEPT